MTSKNIEWMTVEDDIKETEKLYVNVSDLFGNPEICSQETYLRLKQYFKEKGVDTDEYS